MAIKETTNFPPVNPGEVLNEELIKPLGLSVIKLAKEVRVPENRLYQIISGKRAVTADSDLRLCKYFGLSEGFFLGIQKRYELELTKENIADELELIKTREG